MEMMRVMLDTSAYSAFMRGHSEVHRVLQQVEEIYLCPIILGELMAGFMKNSTYPKIEPLGKLRLCRRLTMAAILLFLASTVTAEPGQASLDKPVKGDGPGRGGHLPAGRQVGGRGRDKEGAPASSAAESMRRQEPAAPHGPPHIMMVEVSADGVQRAQIIVDSYSYKPDHLIVMANAPVELTLRRVSRMVPHNFVIQAKEAGMEIHEEVPLGKRLTVRFTPTQAGKFKFFCDKKLLFLKSHEARGMVGTLEVREATP